MTALRPAFCNSGRLQGFSSLDKHTVARDFLRFLFRIGRGGGDLVQNTNGR
jgi:hypothetical protein